MPFAAGTLASIRRFSSMSSSIRRRLSSSRPESSVIQSVLPKRLTASLCATNRRL